MWQFLAKQLLKLRRFYGNLHLLVWKINTSSITLWKTSRAPRIKCFRADMSNLKQTRFVFAIYCVNVKKHALLVGRPIRFFGLDSACTFQTDQIALFKVSIQGFAYRPSTNDVVVEITTTVLSNAKEPNRYQNYLLRKAFLIQSAARVRKEGIFPNNS